MGRTLDKTKTIANYGIGYQTNNIRVTVKGVPPYMFGVEGVIKMMKTSGEWDYNEHMIDNLGLIELVKKHEKQYGKANNKLMTAVLVEYLKTNYPQKA